MSYSEVLKTSGNYRVRLVADEYADEPYDDGQSPLLQLDIRYSGNRAEHKMATGRPTGNDERIEEAACRWGTDFGKLEKYLRAYYGTTQVKTWHSGSYWYVTYDTAEWREHVGAPPCSVDMSEWRAWCEDDVWGYIVEKRVTWHTDDPDYSDEDRWEEVPDGSCWGFYGRDYAEQCALEALAYADEPYAHMRNGHQTDPVILARWTRETVTRKHSWLHEHIDPDLLDHQHDDPRAPFTIAEKAS